MCSIIKSEMPEGDYGTLSEEERWKRAHKTEYATVNDYLQNKICVVVDDVKVTGVHENHMASFMTSKGARELYFLYVATIDPTQAKELPEVENTLNHVWINNLVRVSEIMNTNSFALNARVVKFILNRDADENLDKFLKTLPTNKLEELFHAVIADEYASKESYVPAFNSIKKEYEQREDTSAIFRKALL